ncbi:tRNA pseudouridine(55) synthase TruB [Phycisphaerales bacterium AB-hyl4]|uniref:tRNA pseudouridine synthase B n=1 Tax=Natronomicrosphaera hydrolytica TaxID=3242702 RepID=A0ABV4U9M3_9BACT
MVGLLVVDKPLGWSSMDVVRRVRGAAGGVKTGHAGTLDPLATGVVVCCLGKATRCVEQIMGQRKTYEADVDLSAWSTTDDREGELQPVEVPTPPTREQVAAACEQFVGDIEQVPPAHSAMRVGGRRAYKLARQGQEVVLEPRIVSIYAIELTGYTWPTATLTVHCGRGTYIRSLARDLGKALGTGGHLAALRRTAVGPYTLAQAVTVEHCKEVGVTEADLLPMPEQ